MNQATALLGLITETSLHAGAGSSVGAIDLPIQREGHNGWPCVFGSAVKGALRDLGEDHLAADAWVKEDMLAVFGPDTKDASENAGAIAVGDARLLLLPVRSLTTAYKWVTCPEALARLSRDAARLGLQELFHMRLPMPSEAEARVATGGGNLFLEEYRFTQVPDAEATDGLAVAEIAEKLAKLIDRQEARDELTKRLVIVSNDLFSHLVQAATPVNAHIALEAGTKTTIGGALWYEETLPPETLLYVPLVAFKARRKDSTLDAPAVLAKVTGLLGQRPWLQLGGNETVGMGWCAVTTLEGCQHAK